MVMLPSPSLGAHRAHKAGEGACNYVIIILAAKQQYVCWSETVAIAMGVPGTKISNIHNIIWDNENLRPVGNV